MLNHRIEYPSLNANGVADRVSGMSGDSELLPSLAVLISGLSRLATAEPEIRTACLTLAQWLRSIGAMTSTSPNDSPAPAPQVEARSQPSTVRRELMLGGAVTTVTVNDEGEISESETPSSIESLPSEAPPSRTLAPAPLSTVAARARLKAECCRWSIERRRLIESGADFDQFVKPTDSELADRLASLPDCYGWSMDPYVSLPDDGALEETAGCYEALADAVELAEGIRADEVLFEAHGGGAYQLLATCASALLHALNACGISKDLDQVTAFDWLRTRVFEDRVFIERHMKLADKADPACWLEWRDEIQQLKSETEAAAARTKEVKRLSGRLSFMARKWGEVESDDSLRQARRIAHAVERLVELGVKPSDTRIRDPLSLVLDELPDDLEISDALAQALRYADVHAARQETEPRSERSVDLKPTPDLIRARELLSGKVAVLIGGQCRPRSREAIRDALGLRELRWITTREHESISNFEAEARRADVAVVLLAIRWASHSFEGVKAVCDEAGKPYVRLPRGYGVNQVAREIVSQVSRALAG